MTAPERRGPERPGPDYPPEWDAEPDECNGICVMGNEVMSGGGYYDVAAYPHPNCPRHGPAVKPSA